MVVRRSWGDGATSLFLLLPSGRFDKGQVIEADSVEGKDELDTPLMVVRGTGRGGATLLDAAVELVVTSFETTVFAVCLLEGKDCSPFTLVCLANCAQLVTVRSRLSCWTCLFCTGAGSAIKGEGSANAEMETPGVKGENC